MINPADALTYIMIWFLLAIFGAAMLGRFNKAGSGFMLGLFLGPIGVLIAWGIRDHEKSKQDLAIREAMKKDILSQIVATADADGGQK